MVEVELFQPPFKLLDEEGRDHIRRGMDLAYYDRDEIILEAGHVGGSLFIIYKGEVAEIDPALSPIYSRMNHYTAGDLFGASCLISGKCRYRFQAVQESLCYMLPNVLFMQLCRRYPEFERFFKQSLSYREASQ